MINLKYVPDYLRQYLNIISTYRYSCKNESIFKKKRISGRNLVYISLKGGGGEYISATMLLLRCNSFLHS